LCCAGLPACLPASTARNFTRPPPSDTIDDFLAPLIPGIVFILSLLLVEVYLFRKDAVTTAAAVLRFFMACWAALMVVGFFTEVGAPGAPAQRPAAAPVGPRRRRLSEAAVCCWPVSLHAQTGESPNPGQPPTVAAASLPCTPLRSCSS
jgi:hypothetical protein